MTPSLEVGEGKAEEPEKQQLNNERGFILRRDKTTERTLHRNTSYQYRIVGHTRRHFTRQCLSPSQKNCCHHGRGSFVYGYTSKPPHLTLSVGIVTNNH